jgi:hypothetical protein
MRLPSFRYVALAILFAFPRIVAAEDAPAAPAPTLPAAPATSPTPGTPAEPVQLPAWMTGEVVKAAVAINMTDPQKHDFNESVGEYVTDHFTMIQKEAKREAPDLEQRVRSRDNSLVHQMDDRMHKILTSAQWPAYENYRKVLQKELKSAPLPQQSGGSRAQPGVGGGRG